jgi:hypothetical protein
LKNKSGNCEFFASALAVMLRLNGIPARLVGGYRGGYYNDVGQYYLVPQKYAHAWVEAYVKPRGWVRIDPTPVMLEGATSMSSTVSFQRLTILMDTLNYYWYVLVINYNLEKQFSLLFKLRAELKRPAMGLKFHRDTFLKWIVIILIAAGCGGALFIFIKNSLKPPEVKVLETFLKKMKSRGYEKKTSQGLEEFASSINDQAIQTKALHFVSSFQSLYYKDIPFQASNVSALQEIIKSI